MLLHVFFVSLFCSLGITINHLKWSVFYIFYVLIMWPLLLLYTKPNLLITFHSHIHSELVIASLFSMQLFEYFYKKKYVLILKEVNVNCYYLFNFTNRKFLHSWACNCIIQKPNICFLFFSNVFNLCKTGMLFRIKLAYM